MTPRRIRVIALLVAAGIVATACGGPTSTTADSTTPDAEVAAPLGDAPAAEPAGDAGANAFLVDQFPTLTGQTLDLADLQGQDVVLWLWAPW